MVDDKPTLPSGARQPRHKGGGSLKALQKDVAAVSVAVERVSEAASSSSKVCRALLLTHPRVQEAVEAAAEDASRGGPERRLDERSHRYDMGLTNCSHSDTFGG